MFSGDSAATGVASAIALFVLIFCFLFFYEADIISVKLHALSSGKIHCNNIIGALVITVVLNLLMHFLSKAVLLIPAIRRLSVNSLRSLWINLLIIATIFSITVLAIDESDIFHYRARMEMLFIEGRYGDAIKVGKKSLATDSCLTMLRIYALAKEKKLGDSLFEYPIVGSSKSMIPNGNVKCLIYPEEEIINFANRVGATDYLLCKHLLNRDLDAFARDIIKVYDLNNTSLPKHYKEALIIYTRTHSDSQIKYQNEVLNTDYEDMQALEKKYPDAERTSYIRDIYGNTYWYYYLYL